MRGGDSGGAAIFQAINVDTTLYMITFGESVINDAVSIVLFESILSQYYINQEHHSMAHFPVQLPQSPVAFSSPRLHYRLLTLCPGAY